MFSLENEIVGFLLNNVTRYPLLMQERRRAAARAAYRADPDKKKAAAQSHYNAQPENKNAAKRASYRANCDVRKAKVRANYHANSEKKKAPIQPLPDTCPTVPMHPSPRPVCPPSTWDDLGLSLLVPLYPCTQVPGLYVLQVPGMTWDCPYLSHCTHAPKRLFYFVSLLVHLVLCSAL